MNTNINGRRLSREFEIKEGLVEAFQTLLFASSTWRSPFPNLLFNGISEEQVVKLEDIFMEEEVLAAIIRLNGDKAPGLDGFPLAFWSFSLDFVKDEVIGFFKKFYEHNEFVKVTMLHS